MCACMAVAWHAEKLSWVGHIDHKPHTMVRSVLDVLFSDFFHTLNFFLLLRQCDVISCKLHATPRGWSGTRMYTRCADAAYYHSSYFSALFALAALSKTTVTPPLIRHYCSSWENVLLDNGQESRCRSIIHLQHKCLFATTLTASEDPVCIFSSSSVIFSFSEGWLVHFYDLSWIFQSRKRTLLEKGIGLWYKA